MPGVSAGNVSWSRDSKKFALVRRDSLKVEKLWVINSLANPRPTLETYRYAMPGDAEIPQSQLEIFDVASKDRKIVKADAFKDQTHADRSGAPVRAHARGAREDRSRYGPALARTSSISRA